MVRYKTLLYVKLQPGQGVTWPGIGPAGPSLLGVVVVYVSVGGDG